MRYLSIKDFGNQEKKRGIQALRILVIRKKNEVFKH